MRLGLRMHGLAGQRRERPLRTPRRALTNAEKRVAAREARARRDRPAGSGGMIGL